jgi:hypothetical protein
MALIGLLDAAVMEAGAIPRGNAAVTSGEKP